MNLTIPATDHGKIRVFSLDGAIPEDLDEKTPEALAATLGVSTLNADFVDVLDVKDLNDLSLPDYMRQGYDITLDAVDAAALSTLQGSVMIIMSRAFGGEEVILSLGPGVRHVTTCGDAAQINISQPIPTASADGVASPTTKPRKSDAAMSGRVAMVALLVMFALVGLMVWIGG